MTVAKCGSFYGGRRGKEKEGERRGGERGRGKFEKHCLGLTQKPGVQVL